MKLMLSSLLCGFLALVANDQNPVPISKESHHHLKLENPYIRIYDVVVPPGQQTLMHVHAKDYFFVALGDSTLKNQLAGQPDEQDLNLKDGEVHYSPATVIHRVRNIGKTPFHNLTVELLQAPSRSSEPPAPLGKDQTAVLDNERIRAIHTVLQPGESTGIHSHPPHTLTIIVRDGSIRVDVPGQKPQDRLVKSGEYVWQDAPLTHSLTNSGKSPVMVVEVEVK